MLFAGFLSIFIGLFNAFIFCLKFSIFILMLLIVPFIYFYLLAVVSIQIHRRIVRPFLAYLFGLGCDPEA